MDYSTSCGWIFVKFRKDANSDRLDSVFRTHECGHRRSSWSRSLREWDKEQNTWQKTGFATSGRAGVDRRPSTDISFASLSTSPAPAPAPAPLLSCPSMYWNNDSAINRWPRCPAGLRAAAVPVMWQENQHRLSKEFAALRGLQACGPLALL